MGRRKKVLINTPNLNQFLYHKMYNFTGQRELSYHLRKHFESDKSAEKFATQSGLEEKIEMMAEMGLDFFICFKDRSWKAEDLKKSVKEVKAGGMAAARKQVVENELALFSNVDYWMAITLMTGASNSGFFNMDMQLRKAFYHKDKWETEIKNKDIESFKENVDTAIFYSKLYVNMVFQQRVAESNFSLKPEEVDIIQYLYSHNRAYVSKWKIRDELMYAYPKGMITLAINRLRRLQLIDSNPIAEEKEYILTGLGIQKALTFLRKSLSI